MTLGTMDWRSLGHSYSHSTFIRKQSNLNEIGISCLSDQVYRPPLKIESSKENTLASSPPHFSHVQSTKAYHLYMQRSHPILSKRSLGSYIHKVINLDHHFFSVSSLNWQRIDAKNLAMIDSKIWTLSVSHRIQTAPEAPTNGRNSYSTLGIPKCISLTASRSPQALSLG